MKFKGAIRESDNAITELVNYASKILHGLSVNIPIWMNWKKKLTDKEVSQETHEAKTKEEAQGGNTRASLCVSAFCFPFCPHDNFFFFSLPFTE
jgi:hypothetical protein